MSKEKIKNRNSENLVKKVLLKGPVFTNSGYGVHSRQVFNALLTRKNIDLYVQPTNWGNTSWILDKNFEGGVVEKLLTFCRKQKNDTIFDESYQVMTPDEWESLALINIGITAGFECDILKESWIDFTNSMDHVIVPSNFTKSAFIKTSKDSKKKLKTKISVINEHYFESFKNLTPDKEVLSSLKYKKNILIMGQITSSNSLADRKNIIKTIKTAISFVKDTNDIGIVLKINAGKNSKVLKDLMVNKIKESINKLYYEKITFLFGSLNVTDLFDLYNSNNISCFLSGSRAEGWGLPFLEAAACGLPVIATDYSAYKEFLEDDFLKVDYDLTVFNFDKKFCDLDKEPRWAEFCPESMKNCLNMFFTNTEKYLKIAASREKIIKQNYSCVTIINDYKKFFESNF